MQIGRYCRIYGLYNESIWCYDWAVSLLNDLSLSLSDINQLESSTYSAKAMCLSTIGLNNEAIEACEIALILNPNNYEAFCNKGIALANLEKYGEAIAAHESAISIKHDFVNSWNVIGQVIVDYYKDYHRAIPYLDKAIDLSGGRDTCAWINKGNALSGIGKFDGASLCWDTAYDIDPQNNVHAMLNKFIMLYYSQNNYEEALSLLEMLKKEISIDSPYYNSFLNICNRVSNGN